MFNHHIINNKYGWWGDTNTNKLKSTFNYNRKKSQKPSKS